MRRTHPEVERPFRVPLGPVMPVLGIAFCLMLMFSLPVGNWIRLAVWLAVGLMIYFFYGRKHSVLGRKLDKNSAALRDTTPVAPRTPSPGEDF